MKWPTQDYNSGTKLEVSYRLVVFSCSNNYSYTNSSSMKSHPHNQLQHWQNALQTGNFLFMDKNYCILEFLSTTHIQCQHQSYHQSDNHIAQKSTLVTLNPCKLAATERSNKYIVGDTLVLCHKKALQIPMARDSLHQTRYHSPSRHD